MNDILTAISRLHRPDGADELLLAALPTLKRGTLKPLRLRRD